MHSPWHRSRLFWSGLAVLLLLLTAWGIYPRSALTLIRHTRARDCYIIVKAPDVTGFRHIDYSIPRRSYQSYQPLFPQGTALKRGWLSKLGWETAVHTYQDDDRYQVGYFSAPPLRTGDQGWGVNLFFANWAIATAYLILWLGGLALWQRWKKQRMQPQSIATAHLQSQQK